MALTPLNASKFFNFLMAAAAYSSLLPGGLLERGGKLRLVGETTILSFDICSGLGGSVAIGLLGLLTAVTVIFMTYACTPHI
jgi:hypothetical protein